MIRIHKWNREDTIINLYYVRYGIKNLPIKNDKELAEYIIGTTVDSLIMQSSNIRFYLGEEGNLTDFSKLQQDVIDEFYKLKEEELKDVVLNIINNRNLDENFETVRKIKRQKDLIKQQKVKEENTQKERDELLRKLGKDPSKFKLKERRVVQTNE